MWRVAESLDVLRGEVNEQAPDRSQASDGSIGDPAHSARVSDHNPNEDGVVCARDFTHDPDAGADMDAFAEHLRGSRDQRIKYVIWNRRMFSSYATPSRAAWQWGPYSGVNPHDKHAHVSVHGDYDSTDPWGWADMALTDSDVQKITKAVLDAPYRDGSTVRTAIRNANRRTEKLLDLVEALAVGSPDVKKIAKAVREDLAAALKE